MFQNHSNKFAIGFRLYFRAYYVVCNNKILRSKNFILISQNPFFAHATWISGFFFFVLSLICLIYFATFLWPQSDEVIQYKVIPNLFRNLLVNRYWNKFSKTVGFVNNLLWLLSFRHSEFANFVLYRTKQLSIVSQKQAVHNVTQ